MASKKSQAIDMGFNLFVYAALGGKNLEQLDRIVSEKIETKNPYARIVSSSRNDLKSYRKLLAPVAKAVGITSDKMMQTRDVTIKDLSRRATLMEERFKSIGANISFSEKGRGVGKIVCYFVRGNKIKMSLVFDIDTGERRNRWITKAKVCFPVGKQTKEFQCNVKALRPDYISIMRQFPNFNQLERGLDVFSGGYEGVADYLIDRYRELGFFWSKKKISPTLETRKVSFCKEEYAIAFDSERASIVVSAIWYKRFRFDQKCRYSEYRELDLATSCDVARYEDAVSKRNRLRSEERQRQEAELQAEIEYERAMQVAQAAAKEALKQIEKERIREASGSNENRVIDLSTARSHARSAERVHIGDLIVRAGVCTCGHKHHQIREVIALVNVFDPSEGVVEVAVDAFCCPTCRRYYVLERDFDRLVKRGALCCRVVIRPGQVQEFIPSNHKELAERSFFRQLGYNASKEEGLSDSERRAILDFAIENGFKTQKQTISFLEWLIRGRVLIVV